MRKKKKKLLPVTKVGPVRSAFFKAWEKNVLAKWKHKATKNSMTEVIRMSLGPLFTKRNKM